MNSLEILMKVKPIFSIQYQPEDDDKNIVDFLKIPLLASDVEIEGNYESMVYDTFNKILLNYSP